MQISIINHTEGEIADEEIQHVIRAINRQIREDFEPNWGMGATLILDGRSEGAPEKMNMLDMRGDAIIYLWNKTDVPGALGYHDANARGIPYGFVFTALTEQMGEPWSVTLSHEALELIGDPYVNLLAMGPHPEASASYNSVFHWFEMCDAVQAETYDIDGIAVSNFVLPTYFTGIDEAGGRNDFLGRHHDGVALKSFGINPGGYIGFYNPKTGRHETRTRPGDALAAARAETKAEAKLARRALRYPRYTDNAPPVTSATRAHGGVRSTASARGARATQASPSSWPGIRRATGI